jgi:hypothetical protein
MTEAFQRRQEHFSYNPLEDAPRSLTPTSLHTGVGGAYKRAKSFCPEISTRPSARKVLRLCEPRSITPNSRDFARVLYHSPSKIFDTSESPSQTCAIDNPRPSPVQCSPLLSLIEYATTLIGRLTPLLLIYSVVSRRNKALMMRIQLNR